MRRGRCAWCCRVRPRGVLRWTEHVAVTLDARFYEGPAWTCRDTASCDQATVLRLRRKARRALSSVYREPDPCRAWWRWRTVHGHRRSGKGPHIAVMRERWGAQLKRVAEEGGSSDVQRLHGGSELSA